MQKFTKEISVFTGFLLIFFCFCTISNFFLVKRTNLVVNAEKNILLLGDSNTECAINDSIVEKVFNFSTSAESYFYSYLKLKKTLKNNSQIDTVLVSFSPHNIFDNGWFQNEKIIKLNFKHYYPFFDLDDLYFILKKKPLVVLDASKTIPFQFMRNVILSIRKDNIFNLGRFRSLNRNSLELDIEKINNNQSLPFFELSERFKITNEELFYLNKIKLFCAENNLKLILINTPKRDEILNHKKYYTENFLNLYYKEFSDIDFYDFSKMLMNKEHFADLVHLNSSGSSNFSTTIKNVGWEGLKLYLR